MIPVRMEYVGPYDKYERDKVCEAVDARYVGLRWAKREAESDRYQAEKVACDCAKHVLTLVLNSGYRPLHISYNSLMAYLDGNEDALLEKLLCNITAVATPSAEMTKKWVHLVLNNSMPAPLTVALLNDRKIYKSNDRLKDIDTSYNWK